MQGAEVSNTITQSLAPVDKRARIVKRWHGSSRAWRGLAKAESAIKYYGFRD